jgi:hypothetical protein
MMILLLVWWEGSEIIIMLMCIWEEEGERAETALPFFGSISRLF